MADAAIRVERRGRVVRCTLDRPPLNLFEPGLIAALRSTFVELAGDATVGVVVLRGSGRAFTAGMNVNVLRDLDAAGAETLITTLHDAVDAVHRAPFPVVAAINGAALGAGFELALACDLRVAARGAILGLPEVRVGVPSVIQAALLAPLIGPGRAAELLLTGATIGAEQALEWGLVNRVAPAGQLAAALDELAGSLAEKSAEANAAVKRLVQRAVDETDLRAGLDFEGEVVSRHMQGKDAAEGLAAFVAKRRPVFP